MVVWSLEHFMLSPTADILPYLNTSVKGTAVVSILFAPVPCKESIRSEQLIYSSQFHVTSVLCPRSSQLAPPFWPHSFFPAVSCSLLAFPPPPPSLPLHVSASFNAADILPYLNTSVKGTAVDSILSSTIMNYHARGQTGKLSSTIMVILNMFKVNDS